MTQLKIMSFNLRGNNARDGVNMWPARAKLVADLIRRHKPDVIGFQELQLVHWDSLVELLPAYGRGRGPKCDNAEPFAYPTLFWNTARLHCLARGGQYLSQTPETFSGSWETACVRGMVWAQLRLNEFSWRPLLFCNAHLDHISAAARLGQAGVLMQAASAQRRRDQPVFVLGDFNCKPGSEPYQAFIADGYRDLFLEAGGVDGPGVSSFHNFTGVPQDKWGRIDWILAQSAAKTGSLTAKALKCEILLDQAPPLFPSDHFPVLTTVEMSVVPAAAPPVMAKA